MHPWKPCSVAAVALSILVTGVLVAKTPETRIQKKADVKERTFLFTYAGAVKDLKPGTETNVWLPLAVSGPEQEVKVQSKKLPGEATTHEEKQYGNAMLFL